MHRNSKPSWRRLARRFTADTSGQVALIFGLCAIPIVIAASVALDMSNASTMKSEIQAAADTAVLAAATRLAVNASEADKEQIALDTFYANLSPVLAANITGSPDVDIDFPAKTVHMAVTLNTKPLLSSLATDAVALRIEASAGVSSGTPICLIALNPTQPQSLSIQGTADILADGCAIHVNSKADDDALYQNGNGSATAESFCVHGESSGNNFDPTPEEYCRVENDPLKTVFASDWAKEPVTKETCKFTDLPQINSSDSTPIVLEAGVYCGGLSIKKGVVQLQTGQAYLFRDGPLEIQSQGTLQGTNVVVLFEGDSTTRLVTQAGASIVTSARSEGNFKGIAFAQHPSSIPDQPNLIIGGGSIEINGIIYFPAQPLKITGNGDIGTSAAQFAIMADTIAIEGNGQLNIKIGQNYQATGLPDLPEADEIVRLTE